MLIQVFPLLALSVIVYNILVLVAGDSSLVDAGMTGFLNKGIEIGLFSGGAWKFTIGDLFIVVSLVLLFVEILKSTVTTANSIANHALSLLVGVVALIEFLMFKGFGTLPLKNSSMRSAENSLTPIEVIEPSSSGDCNGASRPS